MARNCTFRNGQSGTFHFISILLPKKEREKKTKKFMLLNLRSYTLEDLDLICVPEPGCQDFVKLLK